MMNKSNQEHGRGHKFLKFSLLLLFLFSLLFALSACDSHEHTGGERCLLAAVCEICGKEYGEPAGHAFEYVRDRDGHTKKCTRDGCNASESRSAHSGGISTCTAGGVCTICGYEYLNKLNHSFIGTTCAELGTCSSCGIEDTKYKNHNFTGATCARLGTCTVCGQEGGEYKSHIYQGATCSQLGKCTVCGQEGGEYSDEHVIPAGMNVCVLCGLDYYTAALQFSLNAAKDGYIVTGIGPFKGNQLVIPATHKDLPVTEIGNSAFSSLGDFVTERITTVSLPNTLVRIGDHAFEGFVALTSIHIPEGVTHIGKCAFYCCTSLAEVTLPESLISIGEAAFCACGLTEMVIPKNVKAIGPYAFSGCMQLTRLELHDGITSIDTTGLISDCTSLTAIRLPKTVTTIGDNFATNCSVLTTVEFEGEITSIGLEAFADCCQLASINLGTKLQTIYAGAFIRCSRLVDIRFPDTVATIEPSVFKLCTALTEIVLPSKLTVLESRMFDGCTKLVTVILPDGLKQIGIEAFWDCSALRNINFPSSLESVGENAFAGCTSLEYNSYQGMGYLGNSENPYIVLVCRLDSNVRDVVVHNNTKCIMSGFLPSLDITSLTIGENLINLSTLELVQIKTLVKIEVAVGNKKYHTSGNCLIETATKKLLRGFNNSIIPSDGSVTIIESLAFANLTGLTNIVIPDTVEELGEQAFMNCADLKTIVIGAGVKKIGGSLLYQCKKIQAIYYNGTASQWDAIDIVGEKPTGGIMIDNSELFNTTKYFYSEDMPVTAGDYWHYVDGKPEQW